MHATETKKPILFGYNGINGTGETFILAITRSENLRFLYYRQRACCKGFCFTNSDKELFLSDLVLNTSLLIALSIVKL